MVPSDDPGGDVMNTPCPVCNVDPYKVTIGGVKADPYRIARAYGLNGAETQALKKLLRCGKKHKTRLEDQMEVISTIQREIEMDEEDANEK
tara:strand:+ start:12371 stop:12643 length:273 start_codon:yes stop_codon:yes gene_type:complete